MHVLTGDDNGTGVRCMRSPEFQFSIEIGELRLIFTLKPFDVGLAQGRIVHPRGIGFQQAQLQAEIGGDTLLLWCE